MESVLDDLQQVEMIAHDILSSKREVINLDYKRNKNREAKRAVINNEKEGTCPKKLWICSTGLFIKVPTEKAKKMIDEDQESLNKTIDILREKIESKSRQLDSQLELTKGSNITRPEKALSREEKQAISSLLPSVVTSLEPRDVSLGTISEE